MKTIVSGVKSRLFNSKGAAYSFAQAGEDIVLQRIFLGTKKGFYVDVGAYHPFRLSNTYYFYLNGWNGINIEPRPGSRDLFQKYRPNDINLEVGVAPVQGVYNYHVFEEDTLNQFSYTNSSLLTEKKNQIIKVKTSPLSSILDEHAKGKRIDFLTIDTEGSELQVLLSNNWLDYSPAVILIEQNSSNTDFQTISALLKGERYREAYRVPVNSCADSVFFLKD